ncbi:MAG: YkvA family protein [Candidatus Binatia bacterium]|nr:YkvA family protein [Candidatus Binatia bacterium]
MNRATKRAPKTKSGKRAQKSSAVFERDDLERIVSDLACTVAPADVATLLEREGELRRRIEALDSEFTLLQRQLTLLLDCLRDHHAGRIPQVPYATIAHAAAAVFYFANEWDLLPDFLPRLGRLDDAAIVAIACERVAEGLKRYARATGRAWRGVVPTRAAGAARPC